MKRTSSFGLWTVLATLTLVAGHSLAETPAAPSMGGIGDAGGGFLITPRRVVFEERTRSAAISLINAGSDTATYRISLVRMRMSQTGQFVTVDSAEAGEAFADTLVRYSPRQVELAPRESQVIRLQLRMPAGLPDGEYRSHLLVQAIPRVQAADDADTSRASGVQVRIVPVYGTAIPVIVRHGETRATVSVSAFAYHAAEGGSPATASFLLERQGNRSVYGDLTVTWQPEQGAPQVVGVAKGISVYSPNPNRLVQIPLTPSAGRLPANGRLLLSYSEPAPDGPLIAQSSLVLP